MPCDAGISRHHTAAAAAAALNRPSLLLLLLLSLCSFSNRPNALRCSWTHTQTDRHALSAKTCSVLKSCVSDSSILHIAAALYCIRHIRQCSITGFAHPSVRPSVTHKLPAAKKNIESVDNGKIRVNVSDGKVNNVPEMFRYSAKRAKRRTGSLRCIER